MGTFDTRGGSPLSPNMDEPEIYKEEEDALDILEAAECPYDANVKVADIIHNLRIQLDQAKELNSLITKALLFSNAEFNEKVIHGAETVSQTWKISLLLSVPLKYPAVDGKFVKTDEPSMNYCEAITSWILGLKNNIEKGT